MTALAKKPFCSPACKANAGYLYDESGEGDPIVTRCPCRNPFATPEAERDAGLAGAAEANPDAFKAALRIIRETALTQPVFTSNDTRSRLKIAQVPGQVIGAAFRQALKDRVIRRIGYVPSTDVATHAHPVAEYESLIFRPGGQP